MLEELSNELKQLQNEAELKNPQVAIMVSGIKESCRECHNQEKFPDKKRLSKVFLTDRRASTLYCKAEAGNVEVCIEMKKLLAHLTFYKSAYLSGHVDYSLAESVADQIIGITKNLKSLGLSHHENTILDQLLVQVKEIKDLSKKEDPWDFFKTEEISNTCLKCHSS